MRHDSLPENPNLQLDFSASRLKDIYLAGGCFWGVEAYMARVPGVAETSVGYANGRTENPTYEAVCRGNTGHAETVHVRYDPARLPLADLLRQFFEIIDPTMRNRQGNDVGAQYRTGIYFTDPADEAVIREVVADEQKKHSRPIVTEVEPLQRYDRAEEYHQKYLEKNPGGYCHITFDTLPAARPEQAAGPAPDTGTGSPAEGAGQPAAPQKSRAIDPAEYPKPSDEVLRADLPAESYAVTQGDATEPPFTGRYWDSDEEGLYVDIATGEPLFTSMDKFHSNCGWPSFTKPVDKQVVKEKLDRKFGMARTEVRSRSGDSHLGHVFTDGPSDKGGLRYCINSAALRFIPKDQLEAQGYGEFRKLFDEPAEEKRD